MSATGAEFKAAFCKVAQVQDLANFDEDALQRVVDLLRQHGRIELPDNAGTIMPTKSSRPFIIHRGRTRASPCLGFLSNKLYK